MMQIGEGINRLIAGKSLSGNDAERLFHSVMKNEETPMDQGAFLAALTAKGANKNETAAIWRVIQNEDTVKATIQTTLPTVENSGTGMDAFKTMNISTAASIIAASGDVAMIRHGSRGITSKCGTVDVAEALGINVETTVNNTAKSVDRCGIGLFNGMSPQTHPAGLGRILSGIHFGTVLNVAASLASPYLPRFGIRGVNNADMIPSTAELMKAIGYEHVLVVHGFLGDDEPGIDEATTLGRTVYREIDAFGKITDGAFYPEDLGLKRGNPESIASLGDAKAEARRLEAVLSGKGSRDCEDIIALNASLIFYTTGITSSLRDGIDLAKEKIAGGDALAKLNQWRQCQGKAVMAS